MLLPLVRRADACAKILIPLRSCTQREDADDISELRPSGSHVRAGELYRGLYGCKRCDERVVGTIPGTAGKYSCLGPIA
jgi:hypothetical protein